MRQVLCLIDTASLDDNILFEFHENVAPYGPAAWMPATRIDTTHTLRSFPCEPNERTFDLFPQRPGRSGKGSTQRVAGPAGPLTSPYRKYNTNSRLVI